MILNWLRLWRFFTGYVWFSGEGGFPERLLTEAARLHIPLSDSRRQGETFFAGCPARDYRRLRPLARRACIRLKIRHKSGLYFRLFPYRKRVGMPVGLALAVTLLILLSGRVWVVTTEGNTTIPDSDILSAMEALGVYPGCRLSALDMEYLRTEALTRLPQVSYLSVNPTGCVARVAVTERDPTPSIQDFKRNLSNMVAARDGRILSVEVYSGQAAVVAGQGVTKGMLLISGAVESASGNTVFRRSAGRVIAETTREISITVPFQEEKRLPAGDPIFRPLFRFLKWDIPLYGSGALSGNYLVTEYRHLPHNGSFSLPIGLISRYYTPEAITPVSHSPDKAATLAGERLKEQKDRLIADGVTFLQEKDRKTEKTDTGITLTVTYLCKEDIAREIPLLVTKNS